MEMVERVAQSLYLDGHGHMDDCKAIARDAIAAMRRPTSDMLAAGQSKGSALDIWRAMIDAVFDPPS